VLLGAVALTLLTSAALALQAAHARRRFLLRYLPDRLARHVPSGSLHVPIGAVLRTAPVLAGCQIALYLAQENLESAAAGYGWPGLSVLFAPAHATVVPLHLLAALCSALVLWTIAGWLRRSRHAVQIAEVLAIIIANQDSLPVRLSPALDHLPDRRPLAGNRGLRSPPLAA